MHSEVFERIYENGEDHVNLFKSNIIQRQVV